MEESQDRQELENPESQETEYANRLVFEQKQRANAILTSREGGESFGRPSLFKYLIIFFIFAIPNDLIDAIDLTGFLMLLSWFISLFLSVATIIIMWFADSELKRVKSHITKGGKHQKVLATTMTRASSKLAKLAPKNPIVKVVAGAILEMTPIISILPWSSISVILAYLDERRTYKEAQEGSKNIGEISTSIAEIT